MHTTVLQWNVWYKENIERVLKALQTYSADIVCLQELTRGYVDQTHENTWEYIAHELGYYYCVQQIPIITEDTQWAQANAIFSRFPIADHMQLWLHEPQNPEEPGDQYRGYLQATLTIGKAELTVATTHMSFAFDDKNDSELDTLLAIIGTDRSNYILTGDFNATPTSRRVVQITDILHHVGPAFNQNTWTTKPFHHPEFEATGLEWRLDYIFGSPDISAANAHIAKTDVSDHLPVLATIALPD
jgi:endonuclease/exonuclease/phosphatase family metal-dependent hydrolase